MLFVVVAHDGDDAEALERRMAAREEHICQFKDGLESGQNLLGGAILDDEGTMKGSVIVVDFPSRDDLDAWIKTDPYVTGDVWQRIEIYPFKLAGMKPS